MLPCSPKWFNTDTNKSSSNYVIVGNSTYQGNGNLFTHKNSTKNQQNLFKSNLISRYCSQEDLLSYARSKHVGHVIETSPKSQQDHILKKNNFIPRKINAIVPNLRPVLKKTSNIITAQMNNPYFKSHGFDSKGLKHLKETSSTYSNENVIKCVRSEKTIPSFLKNTAQNRRKLQECSSSKSKNMLTSFHSNFGETGIKNFQITEKLGEGKFGSVFLAVQKLTGFMVALKIVQKKRVIQQNFLTQFIRQIKIQAFLQHPNIAKIYGFFHDQNYFYSILQLGEGGQLYDIIKNGQMLSEESTSFIIGNLLDAINYIHEKKILHRDIKPENIVLVHGNVKLCDFGWAVYKKGQLRSTFCGTPLYLSPQLLNGQKYDQKVDLWAIGILAFELHLGSSPFNIQSQQDLLKIITDQIQYPQDCHISKNFKQFVVAVLKKDPRQRLQAKQLMQLKFIKRYKQLQTCEELCQ